MVQILREVKNLLMEGFLQTFRSDIDYHYLQAMTKYGSAWDQGLD